MEQLSIAFRRSSESLFSQCSEFSGNWELKVAEVVTAGWLASICRGEKNHHAALLKFLLFGLINHAWELSLGKMLNHTPTKTEFCKKRAGSLAADYSS